MRSIFHWTVLTILAASNLPVFGVETVMRTESWESSPAGVVSCGKRISALRSRNLLAKNGVKLVDGPRFANGEPAQLTDGQAGVYIGRGRVLVAGEPAKLTYYLGRPASIRQVGVFTFNSDTRANQQFEVRFAKSVELPGAKPDFSQIKPLSTGELVLGRNAGGFHTCFRAKDGGNLTQEPVDWVEFRFWPTLGTKAGSRISAKGRRGEPALVELEVLSHEPAPVWEPEESHFRRLAQFDRALSQSYRKLASWRETMTAARDAFQKTLPDAPEAVARLWERVNRDFPDAASRSEMAREREDGIWEKPWIPGDLRTLAERYVAACPASAAIRAAAARQAKSVTGESDLQAVRVLYARAHRLEEILNRAEPVNWRALRLAVEDLTASFGKKYRGGPDYLRRIAEAERLSTEVCLPDNALTDVDLARIEQVRQDASQLQREALLANPLLDFEEVLLVRRRQDRLGLPANWQSNSSVPKTGYDNEIARLSIRHSREEGTKTVFRPAQGEFVGDVDLHFDAQRMLFSMPAEGGVGDWQVFELGLDGSGLRNLTAAMSPGSHNYDGCYLPDGHIAFTSTAGMAAVPCVRGSSLVATLFRMNADGSGVRQLCFDQEHSWCPTLMHDGRILYTRWEYADLPHSNSRMLFTANPDGTDQRAFYGSGSFWPNSTFYARPVPGHPTMVAGTITGHHAPARMGELILFDPACGAYEADGVVQRIPGHGQKVEPLIRDGLTAESWPKFLHPFPLNEHYLLVSAKLAADKPWGIYLVDVFDNLLLIREEAGYALFEPLPLRRTTRPPVIPDRTNPERKDALMLVSDIYAGPGLAGIPRGEVKNLRLFTFTYAYPGVGGLYGSIGMDGPWDMRRTLGTVPVAPDGSVVARIPANTPIAAQPLDGEGKALQLMRSWFTAMPGETLSCVGCHERLNDSPSQGAVPNISRAPAEIEPWRGPARNYEFARELQPVLDQYCLGCHDGKQQQPDLRGTVMLSGWSTRMAGNTGPGSGGKFSVAYANLHRYVRRPGIESPMPLQVPMEFHADTTELVQLLTKGHHNVQLDPEAWDRIITWIDFNAPYHGRWSTIVGEGAKALEERRAELRGCYANVRENHEELPEPPPVAHAPVMPAPETPRPSALRLPGWPFGADEARRRQASAGQVSRQIDLGDGVTMDLVRIPDGTFAMGSVAGYPDELPMREVRIGKAFWMAKCEVNNRQFRQFEPAHDSREEDRHGYQFGIPGYNVNEPGMPAVRLSWRQAVAFCEWLSQKLGVNAALPTEAQWEWACRAGSDTAFSFGGLDTDFSPFENLGDASLADFSGDPYTLDRVKARYNNPENPFDNWIPQEARFNDGGFVSEPVGKYQPNAWGLHDMHGNVAEWTASPYRPYPYQEAGAGTGPGKRVVRGGSWYDRPKRCTSSYRFGYREYQKVFNVGFRVVLAD